MDSPLGAGQLRPEAADPAGERRHAGKSLAPQENLGRGRRDRQSGGPGRRLRLRRQGRRRLRHRRDPVRNRRAAFHGARLHRTAFGPNGGSPASRSPTLPTRQSRDRHRFRVGDLPHRRHRRRHAHRFHHGSTVRRHPLSERRRLRHLRSQSAARSRAHSHHRSVVRKSGRHRDRELRSRRRVAERPHRALEGWRVALQFHRADRVTSTRRNRLGP